MKKIVRVIAISLVVFIVFCAVAYFTDKNKVDSDRDPVFARPAAYFTDGGSVIYTGPFYVVYKEFIDENGDLEGEGFRYNLYFDFVFFSLPFR